MNFNWPDYCVHTQSLVAPYHLFADHRLDAQHSNNFSEGMLLEAVDLLEPNLICIALIRRVVDHLLLLHFIGWDDRFDQWCDFRSPNIFPVGYCDLVQYPLQGPPGKDGGAVTPNKSFPNHSSFTYGRKGRSTSNRRKSGNASVVTTLNSNSSNNNSDKHSPSRRRRSSNNNNSSLSFINGGTTSTKMDLDDDEDINDNPNHSNKLMNDHDHEIKIIKKEKNYGMSEKEDYDEVDEDEDDDLNEEYNFTNSLEPFLTMPLSTSENSLTFNNIDDLMIYWCDNSLSISQHQQATTSKSDDSLVIQLHNRKRIHLGWRSEYDNEEDDLDSTRPPSFDTLFVVDETFQTEIVACPDSEVIRVSGGVVKAEENVNDHDNQNRTLSSRMISSEDLTNVLERSKYQQKGNNGTSTIDDDIIKVIHWNEKQVGHYLMLCGYGHLYNDIQRLVSVFVY